MFKDIIILGPTSSGKTDLANFIATNQNIPVFNCDSVQVYRDLDILSNKPEFITQEETNGEIVCFTKPSKLFNFNGYIEFDCTIITHQSDVINTFNVSGEKLHSKLLELGIVNNNLSDTNKIKNYLFDIKNPLESYSVTEFVSDISRISHKEKFDSKILAGGTIYYAYNYIFQSEPLTLEEDKNLDIKKEKDRLSKIDLEQLLEKLKNVDPDLLAHIDVQNKSRIINALAFNNVYQQKYSENYFKKKEIIGNFALVLLYPKDRESYTDRLNNIVNNRMNTLAMNEIEYLLTKYGTQIESWLNTISYEYKYGLEIYKFLRKQYQGNEQRTDLKSIISILQAKERQYTKRQVTFMKKLEKELLCHSHESGNPRRGS